MTCSDDSYTKATMYGIGQEKYWTTVIDKIIFSN